MRPGAVVIVAAAQVNSASLPGPDNLLRFTLAALRDRRAWSRRVDTRQAGAGFLAQVRQVAV